MTTTETYRRSSCVIIGKTATFPPSDLRRGPHALASIRREADLTLKNPLDHLCGVLDECSRSIVHWDLREAMRETDIEVILERAKEKYPEAKPRIISDNAPQFIARDFKELIRISGMTYVRTSAYYPQSNGKIERWHKSLKSECIRPGTPLSLGDALRLVQGYVALQPRTLEQRHRLYHAAGYAGRTPGGDSGRQGSEIGGGERLS